MLSHTFMARRAFLALVVMIGSMLLAILLHPWHPELRLTPTTVHAEDTVFCTFGCDSTECNESCGESQ